MYLWKSHGHNNNKTSMGPPIRHHSNIQRPPEVAWLVGSFVRFRQATHILRIGPLQVRLGWPPWRLHGPDVAVVTFNPTEHHGQEESWPMQTG